MDIEQMWIRCCSQCANIGKTCGKSFCSLSAKLNGGSFEFRIRWIWWNHCVLHYYLVLVHRDSNIDIPIVCKCCVTVCGWRREESGYSHTSNIYLFGFQQDYTNANVKGKCENFWNQFETQQTWILWCTLWVCWIRI